MYALVEIQGNQYRIKKGSRLVVERISGIKDTVEIDKVLLVSDKKDIKIGNPYVPGVKVEATLVDHFRAKKIKIYKYKRRKNYRRKQGHRQNLTHLRIDNITVDAKTL